jgi:hypothetical protein
MVEAAGSPKRFYISTTLNGVTSNKTVIFIFTGIRTPNLKQLPLRYPACPGRRQEGDKPDNCSSPFPDSWKKLKLKKIKHTIY